MFSNIKYKNKLKCIKRININVKPDHKTHRGKHRQTLFDVNHSSTFLDMSPKPKEIKAKVNLKETSISNLLRTGFFPVQWNEHQRHFVHFLL